MESDCAAVAASVRISTSMESRCLMVRSSEVTPIAATQSREAIRILYLNLSVGFIQRFPARKLGLAFIPLLNSVFPKLPAQVDDAALPDIGKIAETFIRVLQKHSHVLNLMNQKHEMRHRFDVLHARLAETVQRRL